jgi:GMP synthase-like glutamine amidotransferase
MTAAPRVAILQTGIPPAHLVDHFGRYDAMFERLLGGGFTTQTFDVQAGALPEDPAAFTGMIITGSSAGAYDDLPWIAPLTDFLRSARGRTKLAGICFGHQIMAQAFGGQVIKSPKGWGLGLHEYAVQARTPWMDATTAIRVPASHQDQVVALPPDARVLAGSDFAPYGMLDYADGTAMSLQLHPEFTPEFAAALVDRRLESGLPAAEAEAAHASLAAPNDTARVGRWIRRFLAG